MTLTTGFRKSQKKNFIKVTMVLEPKRLLTHIINKIALTRSLRLEVFHKNSCFGIFQKHLQKNNCLEVPLLIKLLVPDLKF